MEPPHKSGGSPLYLSVKPNSLPWPLADHHAWSFLYVFVDAVPPAFSTFTPLFSKLLILLPSLKGPPPWSLYWPVHPWAPHRSTTSPPATPLPTASLFSSLSSGAGFWQSHLSTLFILGPTNDGCSKNICWKHSWLVDFVCLINWTSLRDQPLPSLSSNHAGNSS